MAPCETTWAPTQEQIERSRMWDFMRWLSAHRGVEVAGYRELWRWSVDDIGGFWDAVREYFDVIGTFDGPALAEERMPGAFWYPGASVNFAENVLRHARRPDAATTPAVVQIEEDNTQHSTSWAELERAVASLARRLRELGLRPGDRVGAVLPNLPETIVAMLATASVGAVWSVSSPDLSAAATLDRLRQLEPRVLIGVDGYRYNGRAFDRLDHLAEVRAGLPTVEHTLLVRSLDPSRDVPAGYLDLADLTGDDVAPEYTRLPSDHPLWVLFSSGTTGSPKGIVHGHGGMLLEALKGIGLAFDLGPEDRYYVAANTSWMVWNTLVNTLATGASVVTYAGSPTYGRPDRQFDVLDRTGATMFAVGAAYLSLVEKAGLVPGHDWDLGRLRSIMSTGSPLPASTWRWVHRDVKPDVHLGSDSGGTDICSGFLGSNPLDPVHLGELQGPLLGVAVEARGEDGARVVGEVGEMVITRPMPSMPVSFWGDDDGARYREAYFEKWPGVWAHGDWISETDHGTFVVHGRSDATLNRDGVRLGSSDIYAAVDEVPEIQASLVIGVELPDGGYYMPLFVVPADGVTLDETLTDELRRRIRARASARHVPDEIITAPAVPVTHANKRLEVPIKKLFSGIPLERAVNLGSVANPDSVEWYARRAAAFRRNLHADAPDGDPTSRATTRAGNPSR
ncbi:acetoacetate--CoA ligase [Georgenia yuyongxinii]|uniref:Acetoacetate--CoA ligase n=1 Tax=Georgenia yuyongxinii TaxID=2589797 RepID=A0A552WSB2_9MICO|nr:acetoacetate--CoA ligase [Georgenia yuyongxinii]TRW45682.1 acetoacetate--CoA ligase [Georgenia yuyongxinii]